MMSAGKKDERNHVLKCIKVYRSLPALWNVKSAEYLNRSMKDEAYSILLKTYQERYPLATINDIKKKINSLRTNFRKELRKIEERKSQSGLDNVYHSRMWYFDEMRFLIDQEMPNFSFEIEVESEEQNGTTGVEMPETELPLKKVTREKRKTTRATSDDLLELACKRLRERITDEDHIGITWAHELKKMDPMQQTLAKKFINDIIFEGQMGSLHRFSVIINGSTEPSTNMFQLENTSRISSASSSTQIV